MPAAPPWCQAARPKADTFRFDLDPETYLEATQLIKRSYVKELSDFELYGAPLKKLSMALPPLCPQTGRGDDGQVSAQDVFDTVDELETACGADRNRLFGLLVNLLVADLDPNTCLLDNTMMQELEISSSGKFGGVGIMVAPRNGDYVVIAPFDSSPGHRAGIKAGDVMLQIDDRPIHGLPLMDVLSRVRGPVGSTMSVVVKDGRTGTVRRIVLKRRAIVIPPVRHTMLGNGLGYLRIVNFQGNTVSEVEKALQRMLRTSGRKLQGIILDLRDNPGGFLDQAVAVANLFISSGPVTYLRGREERFNREFKAANRAIVAGVPTVVLINHGTASASEVLAGALQGKQGVTVLGSRSFGKASVQAVYPIKPKLALRLTTAHYYTAKGADIEGVGLTPDVHAEEPADPPVLEEPRPPDSQKLQNDPWIVTALGLLSGRGASRSDRFPLRRQQDVVTNAYR